MSFFVNPPLSMLSGATTLVEAMPSGVLIQFLGANLCVLCVSVVKEFAEKTTTDTENAEVAQRRIQIKQLN